MLEERVASFFEQHQFTQLENLLLLVGVSGGPDSMALLAILHQLQPFYKYRIMVVHVNHQLRGVEADLDQALVEETCKNWHIPYVLQRVNVKEYMQEYKLGSEEAARILRYDVFRQVAHAVSASHLFLAHHADDQVETVLMHLYDGTGLQGLKGMDPLRHWEGKWLVRPLLGTWRNEIEAYCEEKEIPYRIDATNFSVELERNWLRHQHIPQLQEVYPQVKKRIIQLAELVADENAYMEKEAEECFQQLVLYDDIEHCYRMTRKDWSRNHIALQRRLVKLILKCLSVSARISRHHVDEIIKFLQTEKTTGIIHLPKGLRVQRVYDFIYFFVEAPEEEADILPVSRSSLPFTTFIPQLDWRVHIQVTDKLENVKPFLHTVVFDYDQINFPLQIRTRQPGDRMGCFGMKGSKKLHDLFIDAKIPTHQRNRWPIISDNKQILWVPLLRRSNIAPIGDETKHFLYITVETTRTGEDQDESRY